MESKRFEPQPTPRENTMQFVTAINMLHPLAEVEKSDESKVTKTAVVLLNKINDSLRLAQISNGFRLAINHDAHIPIVNPHAWSEEWKGSLLYFMGIDLQREDYGIFEVNPEKVRAIEEKALRQNIDEAPTQEELDDLARDIENTSPTEAMLSKMGNSAEEIARIIKNEQATKRDVHYDLKRKRDHIAIWKQDYQSHWETTFEE